MSSGLAGAGRKARALSWPAWFGLAIAVALVWAAWPTLAILSDAWNHDARYSHGWLVPVFAGYLLWARRGLLDKAEFAPSWWGLALLAAGLALRFAGTYLYFDWLAAMGVLPCLAGAAVLAAGWPALRWSWPAIAFLAFMVPLPFQVAQSLGHPLQRFATAAGTYLLQALGFVAVAEGNIIRMGDVSIGVVEACSGLSMLVIFFALSTAVVLLSRRSPLERALLFLSAVPIALVANLTRIVVTAVLHKTAGHELADLVFHDLAGWLMMPLGLGLLWVEMRALDWVFVPRRVQTGPAFLPLGLGPVSGQTRPRAQAGVR
jgi:exosortase